MSDKKNNGELKAIILVGLFFYILIGIDSKTQYQWIQEEINAFALVVDEQSLDKVMRQTNDWFYYVNEDLGLKAWLVNMFIAKTDAENPAVKQTNKLAPLLERIANNIQYNVYLTIYRITQVQFWFLVLWPLLLAIIYEGYNQWVTKRYAFGQIDTTRYNLSKRSVLYIAGFIVFYILTPIPISSIAVLLPIFVLLLLAWASQRTIKGYKKNF